MFFHWFFMVFQGNAPDFNGERPLHMAARLGQDGIVRRLLRCGANKEALTSLEVANSPSHDTCLHYV